MVNVPEALTALRVRAGLSQRDLAAAARLARSTIQRVEIGDSWPSARTIRKWVAACAAARERARG